MDLRKKAQEELRQLTAEIDARVMARKVLIRILGDEETVTPTKRAYKKKRTYKKRIVVKSTKANMPTPILGKYSNKEVEDVLKDSGKDGLTSREALIAVNVRRPKTKIKSKAIQNSMLYLWNNKRANMKRKKVTQEGSKRPCYKYYWTETQGQLV